MNKDDFEMRDLSGKPDSFFYRLYDYGGMGVLRFRNTFQFLLIGEESSYIVYSHSKENAHMVKANFLGSSRSSALFEQHAVYADQLFHIRHIPQRDISSVMLSVEKMILSQFPRIRKPGRTSEATAATFRYEAGYVTSVQ